MIVVEAGGFAARKAVKSTSPTTPVNVLPLIPVYETTTESVLVARRRKRLSSLTSLVPNPASYIEESTVDDTVSVVPLKLLTVRL